MAKEKEEIILEVKVDYEEAYRRIGSLKVAQQQLLGIRDGIKKSMKEEGADLQTLNTALAKNEAQYKQNALSIKAFEKEIQNNIKYGEELEGSYNKLSAELSILTDRYNKLGAAQQESGKGQELQRQMDATLSKMKELKSAYGDHRLEVGNYEKANIRLKSELRQLVEQIANMTMQGKEGTKEFQEMVKRAGEMRDAMDDANQSIGSMASDTGSLNALTQGFQGIAGAYGIYNSVAGAMIKENDALANTMKNMQVVMVALSSATAIQNALQKQSALMTGVQKIQLWAHKKAIDASTKSTIAATVAQRIYNSIAAANPYILIGIALLTVIGALIAFSAATNDSTEKQKKLNEAQSIYLEYLEEENKRIKEASDQRVKEFERQIKVLNAQGGKQKEIRALEDEIMQEKLNNSKELVKKNKEEIENLEKNKQALENYRAELLRLKKEQTDGKKWTWIDTNFDGNSDKRAKVKEIIEQYQKIADNLNKKVKIATEIIDTEKEVETDSKVTTEQRKKEAADRGKELRRIELESIRARQDAELNLIKDDLEKQRQTILSSYARRVEDLKNRLTADKNLTKKSRDEINKTIVALEKAKNNEIIKLDTETFLTRKQKELELRLSTVKENSKEELKLKLESLEFQRKIEIKEAEKTGVDISLVNTKYLKLQDQEEFNFAKQSHQKLLNERKVYWDNLLITEREKSDEKLNNQLEIDGNVLDIQLQAKKEELAKIADLEREAKFNDVELDEGVLLQKQILANEIMQLDIDITKNKEDQVYKRMELESEQFAATAQIYGSLSDLLENFSEDNEALAGFQKTMALFEIGLNAASAISKAVAAGAGVPFPANIGAIAGGISAVTTAIGSAYKLLSKEKEPKAPKFSMGGAVTGPGTGTSDSINAMLSNGESVMASMSTSMFSPLLSTLNQMGGGAPIVLKESANQIYGEEMLSRAFAKAISQLPNPIVTVEEINKTGNRVDVLEALSAA